MKHFLTIGIICSLWAGCKSPTFKFQKELDHTSDLVEIQIDNSYHLYMRSICLDERNFPIDCPSESIKPVEIGYIIISPSTKRVLVINNNPNRNQKFFRTGRAFEKLLAQDTTDINVFYFKQFRYGVVENDPLGPILRFETAEKKSRTLNWNCDFVPDTLKIRSVAQVLPDGQDIRYTDASLYLIPKFIKNDPFRFVFEMPGDLPNRTGINRPPCKIYVHKTSKKDYTTYFEFESPVYKEYKVIKFGKKRMYAFSK